MTRERLIIDLKPGLWVSSDGIIQRKDQFQDAEDFHSILRRREPVQVVA